MSYHTATVDAGNPLWGTQDTLRTLIDAHPAWEHVETVLGTGTRRADVYRCLGSANSWGTDYFMAIMASASGATGGFGFGIAEGYDATNKRLQKHAPYTSSNTVVPAADGSYATDRHVANENTSIGSTAGHIAAAGGTSLVASSTAPAANAPIHLSITNDRIMVTIGTTHSVYVGLHDRHYDAATDPAPLYTSNLFVGARTQPEGSHTAPASQVRGATTRELSGAVSQTYNWMAGPDMPASYQPLGTLPAWGKDAISSQWYASRIRIQANNKRPNIRGYLKDAVAVHMGDVAHGVGDTMTLDGQTHVAFYSGASGNFSVWVPTV